MNFRKGLVRLRDTLLHEVGFRTGRFEIPRSLFETVRPHTMCSIQRLDNMYRLARAVENRGIAGSVVECGVWRGGCAGVAAAALRRTGSRRRIHLFDSFQGLPEPGKLDGALAARYSDGKSEGRLVATGKCVATVADVEDLFFGRLAIDRESVSFHVGWFQESVPRDHEAVGPISLLRLDGDWYDSTKVCLKYLYPHVVRGGFVILDDYGQWEGCRRAFEEYRESEKLAPVELERIDYTGVYFAKP
jgi:hypothetical protein